MGLSQMDDMTNSSFRVVRLHRSSPRVQQRERLTSSFIPSSSTERPRIEKDESQPELWKREIEIREGGLRREDSVRVWESLQDSELTEVCFKAQSP
ncbi:hypothetical protein C1H46_027788 [Malus baccata]|uniref:Uncharacterized protein n=1 Tax=Malus baccata TaxID=106549 RepID=A0A540LK30_MALBA|nr:hypothetical protein C1H46_027788 [Malus baccata]